MYKALLHHSTRTSSIYFERFRTQHLYCLTVAPHARTMCNYTSAKHRRRTPTNAILPAPSACTKSVRTMKSAPSLSQEASCTKFSHKASRTKLFAQSQASRTKPLAPSFSNQASRTKQLAKKAAIVYPCSRSVVGRRENQQKTTNCETILPDHLLQ